MECDGKQVHFENDGRGGHGGRAEAKEEVEAITVTRTT